ncbi:PREDICTED: transmembrane 9 superfamily member 12-like [Ipomoea nil]|uniref:transmembrane 9 superfamily member 12-like n=1 Tax=Ipomoea nil TaxID=35883 RepID=UPI000901EE0C|nr:PREDICTED: transmembrane 9 superfamily member 12-like [Ipomoea nil]
MSYRAMESPGGRCFAAFILLLILVSQACHGFHLPGSYNKHIYSKADILFLKVNSLTSINTQLPFSYYSLPYCIPPMGIKKSAHNLGQILMGDQIVNSPYRLRMNVNESIYLCTSPPLSADDVKRLKQRTRDLYQVNLMLDGLPLRRYARWNEITFQWTGFPVGFTDMGSNGDYLINHLKFRVLVHKDEEKDDSFQPQMIGVGEDDDMNGYGIVGVEVVPCSIKYDHEKMYALHMYDHIPHPNYPLELNKFQVIREQERVSYTYEVEFVKSEVRWESRWDAYRPMEGTIHRLSILSSLVVIFLLAGGVLKILKNTVKKQVHQQPQGKEDLPGWRLIMGDVFREPGHSMLLCVVIGNGVQITGAAILTVVFAALGFISPASPGMLLLGLIVCYHLSGILSGYIGVRLWITLKGTSENWKSVSFSTSCFFPGIVFVVRVVLLDFIYWGNYSTAAISMYTYLQLFLLWFCISVPLTLLGGYLGTKPERTPHPLHTNHVPREITAPTYQSWLLVLVGGSIAFSTLFLDLFFILSTIWFGQFYFAYGFLLVGVLLLVVVCAQVSVVLTYVRLRAEDWKWWWKAFFASGSAGFFVFAYCAYYLVYELNGLSGLASTMIYLGYSLLISMAVMLSTGAIGFLTSLYFVRYLYSSLNIDAII